MIKISSCSRFPPNNAAGVMSITPTNRDRMESRSSVRARKPVRYPFLMMETS